MQPLTETGIRNSFVNCSKGEARRLTVPRHLDELCWPELDFLGWVDPAAPGRAYLVAERDEQPVGVALRFPSGQRGLLHKRMCSLCQTTHQGGGVSLMVAPKTGAAGRAGNTVGTYLCTDLACSEYLRGTKKPDGGNRMIDSRTLEEQIEAMRARLLAFLDSLAG